MEGGPTVAIEIRSPGDETYEKFDFYAAVDTAEVWVIDRDTKVPEIYVLEEGRFERQTADRQGWLTSPSTQVRMRSRPQHHIELRIGEDKSSTTLPRGE